MENMTQEFAKTLLEKYVNDSSDKIKALAEVEAMTDWEKRRLANGFVEELINIRPKLVWESSDSVRQVMDERVWAMDLSGKYVPFAWISDVLEGGK